MLRGAGEDGRRGTGLEACGGDGRGRLPARSDRVDKQFKKKTTLKTF